jgi:hypothetical protein
MIARRDFWHPGLKAGAAKSRGNVPLRRTFLRVKQRNEWPVPTPNARDLDCALLRVSPSARLADLVQRIKGGTAHDANHHLLLKNPIRWQAGYWAESLGPDDFEALADYIRLQRIHHDRSHPAERWQFGDDGEPALLGGL